MTWLGEDNDDWIKLKVDNYLDHYKCMETAQKTLAILGNELIETMTAYELEAVCSGEYCVALMSPKDDGDVYLKVAKRKLVDFG